MRPAKMPLVTAALCALAAPVWAAVLTVPSTWDPYLAGMPDGSIASAPPPGASEPTDVAPANRPTALAGLALVAGDTIHFSAMGTVAHGPPPQPFTGADGRLNEITGHFGNAQNGIAAMTGPTNALVGLFLDAAQPSLSGAPAALDFSSAGSRDYVTLAPGLKQPFFIGDGVTGGGTAQSVVVPAGATRLFLTTWDIYSWADNQGSFAVTAVPEPGLSIAATAVAGALLVRRRRRQAFPRAVR